jgi:UDP-N-acetylglucosamine:LPS N-acetylglucosamine transferase
MIEERGLTGERLADAIVGLLADDARRLAMAAAARTFARPDATRAIADKVLELAGAGA